MSPPTADVGGSLLIAAACLLLHVMVITNLVHDFRGLPDGAAKAWRQLNPMEPGYSRWGNAVVGGVFAVLATGLMVVFILGGAHMTLIGVAELALAGGWLIFLRGRT